MTPHGILSDRLFNLYQQVKMEPDKFELAFEIGSVYLTCLSTPEGELREKVEAFTLLAEL